MIFVFGSNLAGRHGKGAALDARNEHGAIYGNGWGRQGNSFAIPTKDYNLKALPLEAIRIHVRGFLQYAKKNKQLRFEVTRIGCGYAGYRDEQIAPLFKGAPDNCELPAGWRDYIESLED